MRTTLIALLACTLPARADDKDEVKKLEGTWEVVSLRIRGTEQVGGDAVPAGSQMRIVGNKMTGFDREMTIEVDPSKTPKWMDLTIPTGKRIVTSPAIYDLDGDELKIAIPTSLDSGAKEAQRPTGFGERVLILVRAKRAKK